MAEPSSPGSAAAESCEAAAAPAAPAAEPAKPAEAAPAAEPKPKAKFTKTAGIERPWDVIDQIEATGGKIRNKKNLKPGEEGYYDEAYKLVIQGPAKKLFSDHGTSLDEKVDDLRRDGFVGPDFTVDDLKDALIKANDSRRAYARGDTPEIQQSKFTDAWNKLLASKKKQVMNVGDLGLGDRFTIGGEEFEVTWIDPDGLEIQVKDGRKFGTQTILEGQDVPMEPGSFVKAPEEPVQFPEPEPPEEPPPAPPVAPSPLRPPRRPRRLPQPRRLRLSLPRRP